MLNYTELPTRKLLGESQLLFQIEQVISSEPSFLMNLYGEQGTGKSTILNLLENNNKITNTNFVLCDNFSNTFENQLANISEKDVLLLDNIDDQFSREAFKHILIKLYSHHSSMKIIFVTRNKFYVENIPGIKSFNFETGNRVFTYEEFKTFSSERYFQNKEIPLLICKNMYLLASYTKNFKLFEMVMYELYNDSNNNEVITQRKLVNIITNSQMYRRLKSELIIELNNEQTNEYLFVLRLKDKIEKLRDLLIKYYPEEQLIFEVMKNQFSSSFIEETFNLDISYNDKLLNICMSFHPIELLVRLLGPRDIILELANRDIGEAVFTYSIEEKAKLILKSIGMNILDAPKGLDYLILRINSNFKQINIDNYKEMSKEYLIGLGISCYQELEVLLYEMVNFYATYFSGSFSKFIKLYNQHNSQNKIFEKRVTFGQYIALLSFINRISQTEEFQLKTMKLDRNIVISKKWIIQLEELSSLRSFYSHSQKFQSFDIPYKTYSNKTIELYQKTIKLLNDLKELNIFPEVIKIKQIIFDEFGRRLFVATNWQQNEIRFSLSNQIDNVDIYSHYYILRKKQHISINPILIPRFFEEPLKKFDGGSYDKSSDTQAKQGSSLINQVIINDNERILDIGCGNGRTTIELFRKNETSIIDAFDLSESMIKTAIENRNNEKIAETKINFFTLDGMNLNEKDKYNLVFSNATLHWMVDSHEMYTNIYRSLKFGGRIALHQGGSNCYRGLHDLVKEAIEALDYQMYYTGWKYPVYYPKKQEYEELLSSIGFKNIKVESVETDGSEYPHLIENFKNAGMLPYLGRLPENTHREKLTQKYYELSRIKKVDQYTHRLFAFASK